MTQGISRFSFFLTLGLLAAALVFTTPAVADEKSGGSKLVGSWQAIDEDNPQNIALVTFNQDKNVIITVADAAFSSGHGTWKKVPGPRMFAAKTVAFVYDASGSPTFRSVLRETIEVSQDKQSYVSAFTTEIQLLDGTVIDTFSGTVNGVRLNVD